jgi:carbonic anhydrase
MRPDFQRWLGGFADIEENVRTSVGLVRNHPLMPRDLEIVGLVYDNETGRVRVVDGTNEGKRKGAEAAAPKPRS